MLSESQKIRRTMFLLEAKNTEDFLIRIALKEQENYEMFLELSESSISDSVSKIKNVMKTFPNQLKQKIVPIIKSLPKQAMPMAAALMMTANTASADPFKVSSSDSYDTEVYYDILYKLKELEDYEKAGLNTVNTPKYITQENDQRRFNELLSIYLDTSRLPNEDIRQLNRVISFGRLSQGILSDSELTKLTLDYLEDRIASEKQGKRHNFKRSPLEKDR
jgi:hypothetical protein